MPSSLQTASAAVTAAAPRALERILDARLRRCRRCTRTPRMARVLARVVGPVAAALILCALPARAQSLVTVCTNGTFTWTYIFDLANSTVDMQGAFHWQGHADIAEDKITWNRDGVEFNVLDRYSGVLWSRSRDMTTQWNCKVAPKRAIQ